MVESKVIVAGLHRRSWSCRREEEKQQESNLLTDWLTDWASVYECIFAVCITRRRILRKKMICCLQMQCRLSSKIFFLSCLHNWLNSELAFRHLGLETTAGLHVPRKRKRKNDLLWQDQQLSWNLGFTRDEKQILKSPTFSPTALNSLYLQLSLPNFKG